MANRRREPVSYRPFRTEPVLAEGLLAVARPGGEVQTRIAEALFNTADQIGRARLEQKMLQAETADQDVLANPPGDYTPATGEPANWRDAIASIESAGSGDYAAVGPRNPKLGRAMGRYQIMEANIGPWSKKHLGRAVTVDEFMRDPKLQDAIFDAEFGSYVKRFGSAEAAAQAWFAGPGGVGKTDRKDVLGTSVGQYGDKFRAAMARRAPSAPGGVASPPEMAGNSAAPRSSWRPRSGTGAGDRAYNARGIRLYQQMLETQMVGSVDALTEQFKEDPERLALELEKNRQTMARADVFPEVQGFFETGYATLAQRAMMKAREGKAKADQAVTDAKFKAEVGKLETDAARRIAGFTGDSADLTETIGTDLALIDRQYQIGVDNGSITPEQAVERAGKAKRGLVQAYYLKQADGLDAAGVAAMREEIRQDFAAGGVEGLDGEGWTALDGDLETLAKTKLTERDKIAKGVESKAKALADRLSAGFKVDPGEIAALAQEAGGVPEADAALATLDDKMTIAGVIGARTLPEAREYVTALRREMGDTPSDDEIEILKFAEKQLDDTEKAATGDPLGHAAKAGMIQLGEIDPSTPESLQASLELRREQAQDVAQRYGIPVAIFRDAEISAIKAAAASTEPRAFGNAMAQLDFVAETGGGYAEVRKTFGEDAADKMQDWQAVLRYMAPAEAAAWLKERSDPKWKEKVQPLVTKGETIARKDDFPTILKRVDANMLWSAEAPVDAETRMMLENDYVRLVGERYAATRDEGSARDQAVARLRDVWGATEVLGGQGGRLMYLPPEKYYPAVENGHDWMRAELGGVAGTLGTEPENLTLVADGKTKAAAERGEPPGYLLSIVDPETGLDEIATDSQGRPLRHFFDAEAARAKAVERAKETRRTANDPWIVWSENSAIGPAYWPWNPASEADKAQRAERMREIAGAQRKSWADRRAAKQRVRDALSNEGE